MVFLNKDQIKSMDFKSVGKNVYQIKPFIIIVKI